MFIVTFFYNVITILAKIMKKIIICCIIIKVYKVQYNVKIKYNAYIGVI